MGADQHRQVHSVTNNSGHPRMDLNAAFTNPLRFSLMAALSGAESLTFKYARDFLETTDSTLSKHISALEELGYLQVSKGFAGKFPQTSIKLSAAGQRAWREHLDVLKTIARS